MTTLNAKLATLGFAVIAGAGLLAGAVKGIVSFVQNLLPSPTQKEGVRPVQKSFRLKQHGIGLIDGLGILCTGFLVVFVAIPDAQAQLPDIHYAGTDIYSEVQEGEH